MSSTVFIGVDLQRDFVTATAAYGMADASSVVAAAVRLSRFAREREVPLILTQDTHEEGDPCFLTCPPHNVLGTEGHRLIGELEAKDCHLIPNDPHYPLPETPTNKGPILLHSPDHRRGLFGNVNSDRLLSLLEADEYVLFGLPLEIGVRAAGLGLRQRSKTTILVSDAIAHLDSEQAPSWLAALAAAGCRFLTTEGIIERYA